MSRHLALQRPSSSIVRGRAARGRCSVAYARLTRKLVSHARVCARPALQVYRASQAGQRTPRGPQQQHHGIACVDHVHGGCHVSVRSGWPRFFCSLQSGTDAAAPLDCALPTRMSCWGCIALCFAGVVS